MEGVKNAVMDRCSLIAFDCQLSSKFAIYICACEKMCLREAIILQLQLEHCMYNVHVHVSISVLYIHVYMLFDFSVVESWPSVFFQTLPLGWERQ